MTRIETIFGGVLALGIMSVFAFVFFGGVEAAPRDADPIQPRARVLTSTTSVLVGKDTEDYVAPTSACECYYLGYDLVRDRFELGGVTYDSQLQICRDRLGSIGSAAFDRGTSDAAADPRERRSCRPGDYR